MRQYPQIRLTEDGSHTLWVPDLKESYHSLHGAVTESKHVFINNGLAYHCQSFGSDEVNILEVGFGTGLNALLACQYSQENKQRIKYTSLEPFPIDRELSTQLNYADHLAHSQSRFWFKELHKIRWGQIEWLNPYFSILKKIERIQEHIMMEKYDICFFDAFAPSKQPDIWEMAVLEVVRTCMKSPAVLVSYSAQGQFRRNLGALGFELESLPGPPGKKEMTRAVLTN